MDWIGVLQLSQKVFININNLHIEYMSIVTLKRKSNAIHSNVSKNGFYLNGTLRNPPPTLIRTPTRTSMKGTAPRGYGSGSKCRVTGVYGRSCGNNYPIVIRNANCCTLQTEVKRSTKNTFSQLSTRFSGILHGAYPKSVTASVNAPSISASDLVQNNVYNTLTCFQEGEKQSFNCQITKPVEHKTTYSEYLQTLKQNCNNDTKPVKIWHTNLL
jgi:hypothetical protein